ncbi:MAG TPA: hypothetical protein VLB83_01940 [Candidatus Paceibacterota bacterium]|nr:hypothetical protein [Candidatus Paceibacterota bacterium]
MGSIARLTSATTLAVFAIASGVVHAEDELEMTTETLSAKMWGVEAFPDCASREICDLVSMRGRIEKYRWTLSDGSHGLSTRMYADWTTRDLASLTNFALVQYIRGCVWNETRNRDGTIASHHGFVRLHLGRRIVFFHRDWEIDTMDTDPAYGSIDSTEAPDLDAKTRRFALTQWRDIDDESFPEIVEHLYVEELPPTPTLFVTDYPTGGSYFHSSVYNASLEFRMCLYRERDIPSVVRPGQKIAPEPIACFEWEKKHRYVWTTGEFVDFQGMAPECTGPRPKLPGHGE